MFLFILLIPIALMVAVVFTDSTARVHLLLSDFLCLCEVRLGFVFGLIPVHVRLRLDKRTFGSSHTVYSINGGPEKPLKKRAGKKRKLKPLRYLEKNYITAKRIAVRGLCGVNSDAAASVILAGTLVQTLITVLRLLAEPCDLNVSIRPDLCGSRFWLNLEGIFTIHSTKIIGAVIKQLIYGTKGG